MAISRVKTWGEELLDNDDLNAEFNNILNNARSLISPLTGALDFDGKEAILDADADTSITADTDDQIDFKIGGTDTFRMTATSLTALNGAAIASGATWIQTVTGTAAATVSVEGFSSTYDNYILVINNLELSSSGTLNCTLKVGGSYQTSTYNYHANTCRSNAATYAGIAATSAVAIVMSLTISSGATIDGGFTVLLTNVNGTAKSKTIKWSGSGGSAADVYEISGAGSVGTSTGALTGIKFAASAGNITMTARLYGLQNS